MSKPRSAKINFINDVEVPEGTTPVTFDQNSLGEIFAYVDEEDGSPPVENLQVLATIAFQAVPIDIEDDTTENRYRVPPEGWEIDSVHTTSKVAPSTGDFVADILYSTNEGGAWTSIFTSGDSNKAYIADSDYSGNQSSLAVTTIAADAWIRVDVESTGDAEGVTIVIFGTRG